LKSTRWPPMERRFTREDGEGFARGSPKRMAEIMELPTLSLLVLTTLASVFALWWLQSVLVPLTLAVGFAQLFQPLVCWLSRLPSAICSCLRCSFFRRSKRPVPAEMSEPLSAASVAESTGISLEGTDSRGQFLETRSTESVQLGEGTETQSVSESVIWSPAALGTPTWRHAACRRLETWGQGLWDIVAVLLCTAAVFGMAIFFVWCLVMAIERFDYTKYANSWKIKSVVKWLADHGVDLSKMDWTTIMNSFRAQLLETLNAVFAFSEGIVLTSLMFFFCLYALLPSPHDKRRRKQGIKHLMQRYLLWKTISSAVIGCAVGFCLTVMQVPLAFVFGMLTFVLNFIPNVGAAIAELLPVPLVLLDPDSTITQAVLVFLIPFIIHNVLGCVLENKLLQHGLDLHPLIVVIALTFWSCVWGVAGAVLSVPLTSVIRLWLEELEHPYAKAACALINGPQQRPAKEDDVHRRDAAVSAEVGGDQDHDA